MKEHMWTVIGVIFALGVVGGFLLDKLSPENFMVLAVMVIGFIFNEKRLSSTNASWSGWTEDAAKQSEARYQALVAMFEQVMAQFQGTIDKTADKAATAAVEKGNE